MNFIKNIISKSQKADIDNNTLPKQEHHQPSSTQQPKSQKQIFSKLGKGVAKSALYVGKSASKVPISGLKLLGRGVKKTALFAGRSVKDYAKDVKHRYSGERGVANAIKLGRHLTESSGIPILDNILRNTQTKYEDSVKQKEYDARQKELQKQKEVEKPKKVDDSVKNDNDSKSTESTKDNTHTNNEPQKEQIKPSPIDNKIKDESKANEAIAKSEGKQNRENAKKIASAETNAIKNADSSARLTANHIAASEQASAAESNNIQERLLDETIAIRRGINSLVNSGGVSDGVFSSQSNSDSNDSEKGGILSSISNSIAGGAILSKAGKVVKGGVSLLKKTPKLLGNLAKTKGGKLGLLAAIAGGTSMLLGGDSNSSNTEENTTNNITNEGTITSSNDSNIVNSTDNTTNTNEINSSTSDISALSAIPIASKIPTAVKEVKALKSLKTMTTAAKALKGVAKTGVKKIPILGLIAGLGFGVMRALQGDYKGAGMEVASGAMSTVPGFGTAGSIAMDAALLARDINNDSEKVESSTNNEQITKELDSKQIMKSKTISLLKPELVSDINTVNNENKQQITNTDYISNKNNSNIDNITNKSDSNNIKTSRNNYNNITSSASRVDSEFNNVLKTEKNKYDEANKQQIVVIPQPAPQVLQKSYQDSPGSDGFTVPVNVSNNDSTITALNIMFMRQGRVV